MSQTPDEPQQHPDDEAPTTTRRSRVRRPVVTLPPPPPATLPPPAARRRPAVTNPFMPVQPVAEAPVVPDATEQSQDSTEARARVRTRNRRARPPAELPPEEALPAPPAPVEQDDDAEAHDDDAEAHDAPKRTRSRRRRGRRGRGGGGGSVGLPVDDEQVPTDDEVDEADAEATVVDAPAAAPPTRLRARSRAGERGTERARGRKPVSTVSEETRRAIAEGPPRRMLVTVGGERTQIAVLEERTLVEHFVTHRADESYVGNIYRGRVQNVLPGMEAAFVDIGKGRNGVLYAGEVNYDESDLEGELPRIEQQLKPGQAVLVQVTKDPMGTKGARLTQSLSIAGRYLVLAPGDDMLGISRKLPDDERDRLRKILKTIKPDGYGLIVRTAAEGATQDQLETDVERLVERWKAVDERAAQAAVLDPVYEEPELVIRVIRDVFGPEHTELVLDSPELAERVRTYLADVAPDLVDKVKVYEPIAAEGAPPQTLFDAYEVTTQIRRALEKKVWLRSGGYLIIEKTEAMWVIDVNTGKFVGKDNLEETVLKNNLEAADEIARQLRLRDMGGIVVIDFVDMIVPANRDEVLKRFKRELARDKTKSRVMDISRLGLVQMTRKNVSHGLEHSFTSRCEHCEGRGRVITENMLA